MKIKIKLNIGGSFQNNDAIKESSTPDFYSIISPVGNTAMH